MWKEKIKHKIKMKKREKKSHTEGGGEEWAINLPFIRRR